MDMRRIAGLLGTAAVAIGAGLAGETLAVGPAEAVVCSVFSRHPCAPTTCSVFRHHPCLPEFEPPIGQDLRLTIYSDERHDPAQRPDKVDTIGALFAALRACWAPAPVADIPHDMQMSVRLSFRRNGELIGAPRTTYVSPGAPHQARERFHDAIMAALERCQPLPFTGGMGGAVAGRPIAIRYVENGTLQTEKP
jgi:hypothetical protein